MKPFDLEAFKRGEPAVARDGKTYFFVAFCAEAVPNCRLIIRDEAGHVYARNPDGKGWGSTPSQDLTHMAPKNVQIWGRAFRTNATSRVGVATDRQFDRLMEDLPPYAKWIEPEPFLIGEYDE